MFSQITSVGNVGAVVEPFAVQSASTPEGARWLNAYIDPAHGNCDTYPDEDNMYSTPLKSHFTYTIDNSFFVSSDWTGTPNIATRSFTVYLTNFPEYPIAVFGTFFTGNWQNGQEELIYIRDPNVYSPLGSCVSARMMYKGMTLRYVGNEFNNQGVVTAAQFAYTNKYTDQMDPGGTHYYSQNDDNPPLTATDIAKSNKEFYVSRMDQGLYCSNQISGARSEYSSVGNNYYPGGIYNKTDLTAPYARFVRPDQYRFYSNLPEGQSAYFYGTRFSFNSSWTVVRFDNIDINQPILIEHFGGYQCHVGVGSQLVNFQSFKSYLDPSALAVASQLTSSLPMIWPASYNDFRQVWRKISRFLGSSTGQSLVNTIASVSGRYGGLISAIGGLF